MSGDSISKKDIRSERQIFHDLELLCASPGYAHAIAYFAWRDNTIKYVDTVSANDVLELSPWLTRKSMTYYYSGAWTASVEKVAGKLWNI